MTYFRLNFNISLDFFLLFIFISEKKVHDFSTTIRQQQQQQKKICLVLGRIRKINVYTNSPFRFLQLMHETIQITESIGKAIQQMFHLQLLDMYKPNYLH